MIAKRSGQKNMRKKVQWAIGLWIASLSCTPYAASTTQLVLTGNLTMSSCGVLESEKDKKIDMGVVQTKAFQHAGSTSVLVPITLNLANCAGGVVNVSFSGAGDASNRDLLALDTIANQSKNLAIEIRDTDKSRLALGKTSKPLLADVDGNISAIFYANYISTADDVTAGSANATASFTIEYN